jgi:hypothetical protein
MSAIHLEGDLNITFIHVPKCAGISIGIWLMENRGKSQMETWTNHPTLNYLKQEHSIKYSFAVVRNPWDRAVSIYHFFKEIRNSHKTGTINDRGNSVLDANKETLKDETFEEFVFNINNIKLPTDVWIEGGFASYNQLHWISPGVDLILKFENIVNDFKIIQDITNCHIPLAHLNSSQHSAYQQYYNSNTQKEIGKIFQEDIDRWQYVF